MKNVYRILCCLLVVALVGATTPVAFAQTIEDPVSRSSSDDDDNTSELVLIGLVTVVVGVLVWLGIKEDYSRWGKAGEPHGYVYLDDSSEEGWGLVEGPAGEVGLGTRF